MIAQKIREYVDKANSSHKAYLRALAVAERQRLIEQYKEAANAPVSKDDFFRAVTSGK